MFNLKKIKYLILSLFFLLCTQNLNAEKLPPDFKWESIKTSHFRIHYHQNLERIALKMTVIAEKVHNRLSAAIGWKPYFRTDVVLVDSRDIANGFSTPFPFNKIQIYISRPEPDTVLNNYNDWLEFIFIHEYTHTLNIDTVSGLPALLRYFPGRLFFPNSQLPLFIIEGNALYYESKNKGMGRNNSAYTDMVIRTEVRHNSFKPVYLATGYPREWPGGQVPYLYGGLFINYLADKYGEKSVINYFHENSDNIIPYSDSIYPVPFFFNKDAKDIFGKSLAVMWLEWGETAKQKYRLQIKKIEKQGISGTKSISRKQYNSILPRFSRDGSSVFYAQSSNRDTTRLLKYTFKTGCTKKICNLNYPSDISVSSKGEIYTCDLEYKKSFLLYKDIFRYNKNYRQISDGIRATHLDHFYSSKRIIYIKKESDLYSLIISDTDLKNQKVIIKKTDIQLSNIRISPDDRMAVFSCKDNAGSGGLMLYDLLSDSFKQLTKNFHHDITPAWSGNSISLIFSSDRNGIYNLYEYSITGKTISRITNLAGGAFHPDVSPDGGQIVFSNYGQKVHMISLLDTPLKKSDTVKAKISEVDKKDFFFSASRSHISEKKIHSKDYNPVYSVFPAFILPYFSSAEYYPGKNDYNTGFYTYGQDALVRHRYLIGAGFFIKQKKASVNISYVYSGFYPDLIAGYYDNTLFLSQDAFPWDFKGSNSFTRKLTRSGFAGLSLPFNYFRQSHTLGITYILEKKYYSLYIPGSDSSYFENILARVNFSYSFSNAQKYPYSISPEDGRSFLFSGDIYQKWMGSELNIYRARAEYSEFLPGIFNNDVPLLRFRTGISSNAPGFRSPYSLGRFTKGKSGNSTTGEDTWGLRGYPAGTFFGTRIAAATAEYRIPLIQKDTGWNIVPLMFRDLWITVFTDYGNVWDGKPEIKKFRVSSGTEIHIKITAGYYLDITAYAGYAHGFNMFGEDQFYFAISTFYEGAAGKPAKCQIPPLD